MTDPARSDFQPTGVHVAHICLSNRKGQAKEPVDSAELRTDHGFVGDVHAGPGHRQVSLLDVQAIDGMRTAELPLPPGSFGENLGVAGLELEQLGIGSVLAIGTARLELTQVGKVCHHRCAIYKTAGDCIMPREGVFARVNEGGTIRPGMAMDVLRHVPRSTMQVAVVTISDRCSRGETEDTSGPALAGLVRNSLDARIAFTAILSDDLDPIATLLTDLSGRGYDLVLTTGGTGFGDRDVTPEATRAVIEREAPGLAEEMRRRSAEITPHALLQRGICGILHRTLIINLPGSEKAATENLGFLLPALPHALAHLRSNAVHHDPRTVR